MARSYRLWVIGALVLLLCIGTNSATYAAETGTTMIGASPNAGVAATQTPPPVATESDQEDKRHFRRARNTAVGILVVASQIGCGFALQRRLSQQISFYKSRNAISNSLRLVAHLFIPAIQTVIAGGTEFSLSRIAPRPFIYGAPAFVY